MQGVPNSNYLLKAHIFSFPRQSERAAHLVNSQSINLDILDVWVFIDHGKPFTRYIRRSQALCHLIGR